MASPPEFCSACGGELRRCRRCDRLLPLDAFSPGERKGAGRCKSCKAAYRREWIAARPGKRGEYYAREHPPREEVACEWCGELFLPARSDARFCCAAHQQRAASRRRKQEAGGDD